MPSGYQIPVVFNDGRGAFKQVPNPRTYLDPGAAMTVQLLQNGGACWESHFEPTHTSLLSPNRYLAERRQR